MSHIPKALLQHLNDLGEFNESAFIEAHDPKHSLTSIRLNPFKKTKLEFELNNQVKWCKNAYYLIERPYFTHDPLFHAGAYYVQEAGSMFLEQTLKQTLDLNAQLKVLDLCAAPGGKSTLINSLISPQSLLVANETVKSRADVLAQNLGRWGTSNTIVTNGFSDRFKNFESYFDAIVVDAPCSGSGLFRKQPDAVNEWSPSAVMACEQRQKTILTDIIPALKPNGILVYSTCSYSFEENENVVDWLIKEHDLEFVPIDIEDLWGIKANDLGYRFYPHLTQSEGFFCAVLRKTNGHTKHQKPFKFKDQVIKSESDIIKNYLNNKSHILQKINGRIHLVNESVLAFLLLFEKQFYFKKAGTLVGEIKGGKLVPEQELAWSIELNDDQNKIELSKEAAIKFLKKENFLEINLEQQLALITYKSLGLGWAKILGNRVNNYLPNELRILK